MESPRRFKLQLVGPLRLLRDDGADVTPRGAKTQGILALLGSSPNLLRSRAYLQDKLWSDRGPEQGAASLRQSLVELRRSLGDCRDCIVTVGNMVGLDPARVCVVMEPEARDWAPLGEAPEFAEGLDVADPEFEDWIRDQRMAFADRLEAWPRPDDISAGGRHPAVFHSASAAEAVGAPVSSSYPLPRLRGQWRVAVAGALLVLLLLLLVLRQALLSPQAPDEASLAGDGQAALDGGPSIAILPFEFTGEADAAQLGFVRAASREIATDLAQSSGLFVVDADAVLGKASPPDTRPGTALDVGRGLGVRYVLRGHVQPIDGRMRAIAQLIETGSGRMRWGIIVEGDADAAIAMQEAIVRGVVDNLRPILIPVCGTESPKEVC